MVSVDVKHHVYLTTNTTHCSRVSRVLFRWLPYAKLYVTCTYRLFILFLDTHLLVFHGFCLTGCNTRSHMSLFLYLWTVHILNTHCARISRLLSCWVASRETIIMRPVLIVYAGGTGWVILLFETECIYKHSYKWLVLLCNVC